MWGGEVGTVLEISGIPVLMKRGRRWKQENPQKLFGQLAQWCPRKILSQRSGRRALSSEFVLWFSHVCCGEHMLTLTKIYICTCYSHIIYTQNEIKMLWLLNWLFLWPPFCQKKIYLHYNKQWFDLCISYFLYVLWDDALIYCKSLILV